jgi:hypothetical protein
MKGKTPDAWKKPARKKTKDTEGSSSLLRYGIIGAGVLVVLALAFGDLFPTQYDSAAAQTATSTKKLAIVAPPQPPKLDTAAYDKKMMELANWPPAATSTGTSTATTTAVKHQWPAKAPYPLPGALLPFKRIVAYYGNFYSTSMGVLGQYPPDVMIPKLQAAVAQWNAADPSTPAIPAIDYIAVTAQGSPGADGKYRFRMPDSQMDEAVSLAAQVHGIVILDVQVGLSNVQTEVPLLKKYLMMPNVELALDPEFAMHNGAKPGSVIGTLDATDINFASNYLATLVQQNNLPPEVLIVHRFTEAMVTRTSLITPLPEVQIVMDMDGWGSPAKKIGTYTRFIEAEPVQFTGFKLFYKNDIKPPSTRMLTPAEILKLQPAPSFIQYQ